MEIVKAEEYGIKQAQEKELLGNLPQIKGERDTLIEQYNIVAKLDIESPETAQKARSLRLLIRSNRTKGINIWHKTTKDFFLQGGKFVDAIKRKEIAVNERMEAELEKVEKHAENLEKGRIAKLDKERTLLASNYSEFIPVMNFGTMSEVDFNNLLNGAKLQLDAKVKAEAEAERLKIEAEQKEIQRLEAQRIENEKLKAEKIEAERLAEIERKKQADILAEQKRIADIDLKKQQEKADKEAKRLADIAKQESDLKDAETKRKMQILADRAKELSEFTYLIIDYNKTLKLPIPEYKAELESLKLAHKIEQEQKQKEIEANVLKAQKEKQAKELQAKIEQEKKDANSWKSKKAIINFELFEKENLEQLEALAEANSNDVNIQIEAIVLNHLKSLKE